MGGKQTNKQCLAEAPPQQHRLGILSSKVTVAYTSVTTPPPINRHRAESVLYSSHRDSNHLRFEPKRSRPDSCLVSSGSSSVWRRSNSASACQHI